MAEIKLIKQRIGSVSSTAQLTKAMQLISASKMIKAQERSLHTIAYAEMIYDIAREIGDTGDYFNPLLRKSKQIKRICLVIIGTGRGFVGSMVTNLSQIVAKLAAQLKKRYPDAKISGISIHNTGLKVLERCGIEVDLHFKDYFENKAAHEFAPLNESIGSRFTDGTYDQVYMVYTHFINTLNQQTFYKKLLPISIKDIQDEFVLVTYDKTDALTSNSQNKKSKKEYLPAGSFVFEPNINTILDYLLPEYLRRMIYSAVLESIASEHSARMVAMKSATDNAEKLKQRLTLRYNRQRQAQITQQLIEVVNGRNIQVEPSIF